MPVQDYVIVASVIRAHVEEAHRVGDTPRLTYLCAVGYDLARSFDREHAEFDVDRFLRASGITPSRKD